MEFTGDVMKHRHTKISSEEAGEFEVFDLDLCPGLVQVMPPSDTARKLPMALAVCGNALVGFLLLGGLILMPVWLAGFISF